MPRKWLLASTPLDRIEDANKDSEQCNAQKFQHSKCIKIQACPLIPKQIYSGDRFLSSRRGFNFEKAHYLLTKNDTEKDHTNVIDVCKEVELLDTNYRRKALRAIMIEWNLIPELNQDKILRFSGSTMRPRDTPRPEYKKKGSWKCVPRKKALLGSADKMLSMPNDFRGLSMFDINCAKVVDYCNNMIAVSKVDLLIIYDDNGEKLEELIIEAPFPFLLHPTKVMDLKWNNAGNKLIISIFTHVVGDQSASSLILFDPKTLKNLWRAVCKCYRSAEKTCVIRCICWSANDRQFVTGCAGNVSVYESDTGKLLNFKRVHTSDILTLSFSPNSKYLVSTAQDKLVRLFAWPEFTPCFNVKFYKPVKAVAWHPQVSDLLCIGGQKNGSLSLWNVNKCAMMAFVRTKFNGCVENLAWNKLSGELVVHWTYREGNNRYTIVAVLASFNQIVDVLPMNKESQLSLLKFNAAHERLITFCNSNVCSIWNFFGYEKSRTQERSADRSTQRRQGVMVRNPIR